MSTDAVWEESLVGSHLPGGVQVWEGVFHGQADLSGGCCTQIVCVGVSDFTPSLSCDEDGVAHTALGPSPTKAAGWNWARNQRGFGSQILSSSAAVKGARVRTQAQGYSVAPLGRGILYPLRRSTRQAPSPKAPASNTAPRALRKEVLVRVKEPGAMIPRRAVLTVSV